MKDHKNPKKDARLRNLSHDSIDSSASQILGLLSFNFKFLDLNQGAKFSDMSKEQMCKFLEKIKSYSGNTRMFWEAQTNAGKNGTPILKVYGNFPSSQHTEYTCPSSIPAGVQWARFRMEGKSRLVGFLINDHDSKACKLNPNVFYVVFLDLEHRFWMK